VPELPFDLFAYFASKIHDKPAEEVTKEERQQAKKAFYVLAWSYHESPDDAVKTAFTATVNEYIANESKQNAQ
jgi:hypothetical protein